MVGWVVGRLVGRLIRLDIFRNVTLPRSQRSSRYNCTLIKGKFHTIVFKCVEQPDGQHHEQHHDQRHERKHLSGKK